jgi:hypothetical protein
MPCIQIEIQQLFGGTYCLHLHDRRLNQATKNQQEVDGKGGSTLLRNVGQLIPDYMALNLRK